MKEEIKVGYWQQKILEEGYQPEFVCDPGQYREKNNRSALDHMDWVREKVGEWEREGHVTKLTEPAWCTSPLSVSHKAELGTGKVKKRLCLDLSRHVNAHLREQHVNYQDLTATECLRQEKDYMCVFDLDNQYFHVQLKESVRKYFGFAIVDEKGQEQFYHSNVMIYGFAAAGAVVTRLITPLQAFLHDKGINTSIYMDDGQVIGRSKSEAQAAMHTTLQTFQFAGWNIQWTKTVEEPQQEVKFLGFHINSTDMTYSVAEEKQADLESRAEITRKVAEEGWKIRARDVAAVIGKATSMRQSHGTVLHMATRKLQHTMGVVVNTAGWEGEVRLGQAEIAELRWLEDNSRKFNGRGIRDEGVEKTVVFGTEMRKEERDCGQDCGQQLKNTIQDGAWILRFDGDIEKIDENPACTCCCNGEEELDKVTEFLNNQDTKSRWQKVLWYTDSKNGYRWLKNGTRNSQVTRQLLTIKWLELQKRIDIQPVWMTTTWEDTTEADARSQSSTSTDEWGLTQEDKDKIFQQLEIQPTVDAFAASRNTVCDRFYSKGPQTGSMGINFFGQTLSSAEIYYCCPPVHEIGHTIKKLKKTEGVTALLVVPEWKSAPYWSMLREGNNFVAEVKRYVVWKPERFQNPGSAASVFAREATTTIFAAIYRTGEKHD